MKEDVFLYNNSLTRGGIIMRTGRIDADPDGFAKIVKESSSYSDVMRRLGYKPSGGMHTYVKSKIAYYKLDCSHMTGGAWSRGKTRENDPALREMAKKRSRPLEDVFKEDSYIEGTKLLRRLLLEGMVKEYRCKSCGRQSWNGKPISLNVHHVNGDHFDNRLENLQLSCPNCHDAEHDYGTKNFMVAFRLGLIADEDAMAFCQKLALANPKAHSSDPYQRTCCRCKRVFRAKKGNQKCCSHECYYEVAKERMRHAQQEKAKDANTLWRHRPRPETRKVVRPSKEELEKMISSMSWLAVGRKYGVSGSAAIKWAKWYGLSIPQRRRKHCKQFAGVAEKETRES